MSINTFDTPLVPANVRRGPSLELRCGIVALAAVLAGIVDFVIHVLWLPSLSGHLAVQQMRPDDAVAEAVRGVAYWANWSHAALAVVVGVFALALLYPIKERFHHASHENTDADL